jgi:hypothetical protein
MKWLALGVLFGFAFTMQAFAIIRSPFPVKPMPPSLGHVVVIGDDAKSQGSVKAPE